MRKYGWHIIHRFKGNPDWKKLNELIWFARKLRSGVTENTRNKEESQWHVHG